MPLVRSPHDCPKPVDTAVNEPDGGDALPERSFPQHSTVPLVRSPHEYVAPADTAVNCAVPVASSLSVVSVAVLVPAVVSPLARRPTSSAVAQRVTPPRRVMSRPAILAVGTAPTPPSTNPPASAASRRACCDAGTVPLRGPARTTQSVPTTPARVTAL